MNMRQIVLEAMSSTDDAIKRYAEENLHRMRDYEFPVDPTAKISCPAIDRRVSEGKPVDFVWAVVNYSGGDRDFLLELARSILPQETSTSLFFGNQDDKSFESYRRRFPLASSLKGGPAIFEMFGKLVGTALYKWADNSFVNTPDEDGRSDVKKRDDDSGLRDVFGRYYAQLEESLGEMYRWISGSGSIPVHGKYADDVLYGAYLGYIFQFVKDARKQVSDSDGTRAKTKDRTAEGTITEVLTYGANAMAKNAIDRLPGTSVGSLTNWGSVYNEGKSVMRTIDPSRMTNANITEFNVYPQYVVDVIALNAANKNVFASILKSRNYGDVANGLAGMSGDGDNKVLPITSSRFIEMLRDHDVLKDCLAAHIGEIFTKWGQSWVSASGESSLEKVLDTKPRMNAADEKTVRAVGIAVAPSLKRSNTVREYTGDGIIAQSHIDMIVGKAVVVKDNAKKSASGAETSIVFDTVDGKTHKMIVDSDIDRKLDATDMENVISRKVKAGGEGHTYFICIPHGIAFAAMQKEDDNIVRNENMDTLCMGLNLDGKEYKYASVTDLMNSPIGKYCDSVAKYGKTGRLRFNSDKANESYAKVLNALKQMKSNGNEFSPEPVKTMADAVKAIRPVLETYLSEPDKVEEAIAPFMDQSLAMSVERYKRRAGKFEFVNINRTYKGTTAATFVKHLKDMYNLDSDVDGYDGFDVKRILEAIVPDTWDLSSWNYANVMKAETAINGSYGEYTEIDDVAVSGESFGDNVGDDGEGEVDEGMGDDIDSHDGGGEIAGEGIGGEDFKSINQAFDKVFERLFPEPDTAAFDASDTTRLQNGLANELALMRKQGLIDINVDSAVRNIRADNFKDFIKKFRTVVGDAIDKKPDVSDDSLRMGAFVDDDYKLHGVSVFGVKGILNSYLDSSYDPVERTIIPVMGSLMVKFAIDNAVNTNGLENKFDRDYLVSSFDENFDKELKSKETELENLKRTIESGEAIDEAAAKHKLDVAFRDVKIYQLIQDKIESDKGYVSKVAGIVVKNGGKIVGDVAGLPTDVDRTFVPFDALTAKSSDSAGNTLVEFCTYMMERGSTTANTAKLNDAFGDGAVNSMMHSLLSSVPKECLSIDYGTDENGVSRLDALSVRELTANEISMLESYYNKFDMYSRFSNVISDINTIYRQGSMKGVFAIDDRRSGPPSPYTYNGEQIDLVSVDRFFTSLMKLAESYNDIGHSNVRGRAISKQTRTQQTMNNERQNEKVLRNRHFVQLKKAFDAVYNTWVRKSSLSDSELAKLTRVMDKVTRQVLSNPMNVLINSNARLISAYAYHEAIIDAERRSVSQSGKEFGFGTGGGEGFDSVKELGKESDVVGRSKVVDQTLPVMRLALNIVKSDYVRQKAAQITAGKIGSDKAEADYKAYLKDYGVGQYAVEQLNKLSGDKKSIADGISDLKRDTMFFCDYEGDITRNARESDSAFAARVSKIRKDELILLLYNTSAAIVTSRNGKGFGDYKSFVSQLSSHGDLLKNPDLELVPSALLEKFVNLDAELQLADSAERDRILESAAKKNNSNNNVVKRSVELMRGVRSYPENRTGYVIDRIIGDKDLDADDLQQVISDMGNGGNPAVGTAINFNCKLNVESVANNDMIITSNVKLKQNDIIIIRSNDETSVREVTAIVSDEDGTYNINPVPGLMEGDVDIPFSRFQARNKFSGYDMEEKLPAVIKKLREWHDAYQNESTIPSGIMDKINVLKMLYDGCSGSMVDKSIVSYHVWRASNYDYTLKPEKLTFRGDTTRGKYVSMLVFALVTDLKTYGPGGEKEDPELYKEIQSILPAGFDDIAGSYGYTIVTPDDVRREGKEAAKNVKTVTFDTDTKNILKMLVDGLGEGFGYVTAGNVRNLLSNPDLLKRAFDMSKEDGDKLLGAINGLYKYVLDDTIKEHNWFIAKPLVEAYVRLHATSDDRPTFDGAIRYVKDNYDIKRVDNREQFANYIKNECSIHVKDALGEN